MCNVLRRIKWGNLFINYFDIRECKQNKSLNKKKRSFATTTTAAAAVKSNELIQRL